jgi:ATP-dependent DNA helicase DinG
LNSVVSAASGSMEELFAEGSPLEQALEGFAPREGQALMAAGIAEAIALAENLVVEAGTGTGKTLAYLIPALLSGKRVILSTGTKTLQDQLFHRDLPMVTAALGRPAKTVLLKGRSNYLCLQRLNAAYARSDLATELGVIRDWGVVTRSGDIAEVDGLEERSPVWPQVTSTVDNCLGNRCEFYADCHVVAARQAAMAAEIVVVNHHLLLADLVLKEEGFGELLPGSEAVIIDEAHQFPDTAQMFFNLTLSSRSLQDLATDLSVEADVCAPADSAVGEIVEQLLNAVHAARLSLSSSGGANANMMWDDAGDKFSVALDKCIEILDNVILWIDGRGEPGSGLQRCRDRACGAIDTIEKIVAADETAGLRWVGLSQRGFNLNYTPIEVAESLGKLLDSRECSWIFTSATLAIKNDFSHFIARMGLHDPRTLNIESPFNYPLAGMLYLPAGMPEPSASGYTRKMLESLRPLIDAAEGRAFLLFTSHRALREAAQILRADDSFNYPLLVQGEAPRSKLLEQFAELSCPVLLGTASFWEGVDMRGDRLVLVAIDKLPFASPGDPLLKARLAAITRQGGRPFEQYQLPQAVLTLKQGVGRLIRDHGDSGVVAICDPRLQNKPYGKRFINSLPDFSLTHDSDEAAAFLATT